MDNDNLIEGKLGATLKVKRAEKDKTLNDLSKSYGISVSYLSKIENDIMKPNVEYITNLLKYLEINEEMFSSGLVMNSWYEKLIMHIIGLEDNEKDLKDFLATREDFQGKILQLALLIHENKLLDVEEIINILMHNISLMQPLEFFVFSLSLSSYHLKLNDYFTAGAIFCEISEKVLENYMLRLWYYEIAFELALYQASYLYLSKIVKELLSLYFRFNLTDKVNKLKRRYNVATSYFLEPSKYPINLVAVTNYERSYRLSLIYHEKFEEFLALEKKKDLAQLLFDDLHDNSAKVKKIWREIYFEDDPFELALYDYFKFKYEHERSYFILKDTLFSDKGVSQHHYCSHFFTKQLTDLLSGRHKYKECYLTNKRLKELDDKRKAHLKNKILIDNCL
jgi:transcriptional regulator with XRE-family HTH domain